MASPNRRGRSALKLERACERSRLEEQVLAAAYELATPFLRRAIPDTASGRRPAPAAQADRPQRQAGGSKT
jgi:hypothetical protein